MADAEERIRIHAIQKGLVQRRLMKTLVLFTLAYFSCSAAFAQFPASGAAATKLTFRGVQYEHRWSKDDQNEFTPSGETDLTSWNDMMTFNVYETVSTGEKLAGIANKVVSKYQSHGKILRTISKPRTADSPAEHLIAAVFGTPAFLEAAFIRFVLVDGTGMGVVYSHRVYGKAVGPAMSDWLEANGQQVTIDLMEWKQIPKPAALKQLPQQK
jgi:hypothetical protein